jgi:hypothetical protein
MEVESHTTLYETPPMQVDLIHAVIGLLFVTVWALISQFSLGHADRPARAAARANTSTAPRSRF